jgi:hypothetical protein
MRASVCFVVPTTGDGHDRRGRALGSVLAQSDPDWAAVAIGSGFFPTLPLEARYFALKGREQASKVRILTDALNHLHLAQATESLEAEWVAVLDEEHTVSEQFVARCKAIDECVDVIVFRTQYKRGIVLPDALYPSLIPEHIGVGITFRRSFAERAGLEFEDVGDPISYFLTRAEHSGARVLLHPAISFYEKGTSRA